MIASTGAAPIVKPCSAARRRKCHPSRPVEPRALASDKHLVSVRQACGSWPALRMAAVVRRQRRHAAWAGGPRSGFRCEGGARNLKNAKRYDVVCPDAARPPKPASGPRPQNDLQLVSKGGVQTGLQPRTVPTDVIRTQIVCCILTY